VTKKSVMNGGEGVLIIAPPALRASACPRHLGDAQIKNKGNSPRHPERSEGSPRSGMDF
jgi:hypothetical protein